jgi:hypothetical protein
MNSKIAPTKQAILLYYFLYFSKKSCPTYIMLKGGQGNDLSYGGEGDDIIIRNQGDDYLVSGAGNDVIRVCLQLLLQNWRYNQK